MSCSRPVAPRSMPARSISSVSRAEPPAVSIVLSVTCPTFIGLPASSNPFSCSSAFFASSASWNWKTQNRHYHHIYILNVFFSLPFCRHMVKSPSSLKSPQRAKLFALGRGVCYMFPEVHLRCDTSRSLASQHDPPPSSSQASSWSRDEIVKFNFAKLFAIPQVGTFSRSYYISHDTKRN